MPAELTALIDRHKENQEWQNWRAALICSILANIYRDPKKKSQPFTPEDFMPGHEKKAQSREQMLANIKLLHATFGGKFEVKEHG